MPPSQTTNYTIHLLPNFEPVNVYPNHTIHLLPNSEPVNVCPYRYPYFQKQEIETQVRAMLQNGIIHPSTSHFSSPVLLVKKCDRSWRFCIYYQALNSITVKDRFPIPTIDELLDELGGASWFLKLDLLQGYPHILMKDDDVSKTSHYEFQVMPFGLCNAPSTFQVTMNSIFAPHLRKFIIVFFDDILVYNKSFPEHLTHLETTFQVLLTGQFFLKLSKCSFAQRQVEYLGHLVSTSGVEPVPANVKEIQDLPQPRTMRALCGFLGLSRFYWRFIKGYALIATPLTNLLTKDHIQWSLKAQKAFDTLKDVVCKVSVLWLSDFSEPFVVEKDVSGVGMGTILSQRGHPIAFFSKPFCLKLLHSSTYVRELAAITTAVKKWLQYLLGHHYTILTNHRNPKELMTQVVQTPEQQMYLARLLGYNYSIQYRSGKANTVVDAVSRIPEPIVRQFLILTEPHFVFLQELKRELQTH